MDIQRQAFETEFKKTKFYENMQNSLENADCPFTSVFEMRNGEYRSTYVNLSFEVWQAAQAQAVPEGFVLIKASDRDQEMLELIDQRDHMESQAEELKDKLQALYGVDFGEHSSCNFPFQNAIDYDDSDLVLVKREKLAMIFETSTNALVYHAAPPKHDALSIIQGIARKAMIEAQEPANEL